MTRRDFELIARTILDLPLFTQGEVSPEARDHVAHAFAEKLAATNDRFDRARFLRASGVQS